jgi:hypothetical protein
MAARYPADWREITAKIRKRAGNACECRGECGHSHGVVGRSIVVGANGYLESSPATCDAPNGAMVVRDRKEPQHWAMCLGDGSQPRAVRIVLTVAHRDHTPENVADDNLFAACQFCHLAYDRDEHTKNSRATRAKKRAVGNLPGIE